MPWQQFSPLKTNIEPERALNFGFGVAVAPLWAAYYAAASAGTAYWWMTRWTEGLSFAPSVEVTEELDVAIATTPAPVLSDIVIEAAPEPTLEAAPEVLAEAAPETIVDATADIAAPEADLAPEAVVEVTAEAAVETPAPEATPAPRTARRRSLSKRPS